MENNKTEHITQRTEEIRDIIDRMPHRTGKIVVCVVCALCVLLLFSGWIIEYPETVSGPVSITAKHAPVRLVSNISGILHLLRNNGANLQKNDVIGLIDNPASLQDVLDVENFLNKNSLDSLILKSTKKNLPAPKALGELSSVYYSFCNALEKMFQYYSGNSYEKKRANLKSLLNFQIQLLKCNKAQLNTETRRLEVAVKNMHRDSLLFGSSTIAELDLDRSSISYFEILESTQSMKKDDVSYQSQINDTQHELQLLQVEQQDAELQLRMNIVASYNELINSIRQWKQRYLFIAPFSGILENLSFWHENDFIPAGTETFSVLPANNPLLGQVYLPSQGAGKVAIGQKVIIKLDNYPYLEYGSIEGEVYSISMLTNQTDAVSEQNNIRSYLITVNLPNCLTTNYGATLDFRYEIEGTAEIITKPRKLLERLFDNLKYIASKK